MTFWPSTLPPDPLFDAITARVLAAAADRTDKEWKGMSDKPSGEAAAQAAATDIGLAIQTVEGFPTKQLQWEMVGKDTDGTPIYRNNWGEYSPWSSVYEKMPPYGRSVLTWDGTRLMVTTWWPSEHGFDPCGVTHWMPLPEPPEVK